MHKGNNIEEIQEVWNDYRRKLMLKFLTWDGSYTQHLQPINMIKNYYGEKQAFYFAFMLHYQAYLIYPTIVGTLVFINIIYNILTADNIADAIDSRVSGIYGMCVPIWGAVFLISWKRKERGLQYYWNCKDNSNS
jgi:hypothetical protein